MTAAALRMATESQIWLDHCPESLFLLNGDELRPDADTYFACSNAAGGIHSLSWTNDPTGRADGVWPVVLGDGCWLRTGVYPSGGDA